MSQPHCGQVRDAVQHPVPVELQQLTSVFLQTPPFIIIRGILNCLIHCGIKLNIEKQRFWAAVHKYCADTIEQRDRYTQKQ